MPLACPRRVLFNKMGSLGRIRSGVEHLGPDDILQTCTRRRELNRAVTSPVTASSRGTCSSLGILLCVRAPSCRTDRKRFTHIQPIWLVGRWSTAVLVLFALFFFWFIVSDSESGSCTVQSCLLIGTRCQSQARCDTDSGGKSRLEHCAWCKDLGQQLCRYSFWFFDGPEAKCKEEQREKRKETGELRREERKGRTGEKKKERKGVALPTQTVNGQMCTNTRSLLDTTLKLDRLKVKLRAMYPSKCAQRAPLVKRCCCPTCISSPRSMPRLMAALNRTWTPRSKPWWAAMMEVRCLHQRLPNNARADQANKNQDGTAATAADLQRQSDAFGEKLSQHVEALQNHKAEVSCSVAKRITTLQANSTLCLLPTSLCPYDTHLRWACSRCRAGLTLTPTLMLIPCKFHNSRATDWRRFLERQDGWMSPPATSNVPIRCIFRSAFFQPSVARVRHVPCYSVELLPDWNGEKLSAGANVFFSWLHEFVQRNVVLSESLAHSQSR